MDFSVVISLFIFVFTFHAIWILSVKSDLKNEIELRQDLQSEFFLYKKDVQKDFTVEFMKIDERIRSANEAIRDLEYRMPSGNAGAAHRDDVADLHRRVLTLEEKIKEFVEILSKSKVDSMRMEEAIVNASERVSEIQRRLPYQSGKNVPSIDEVHNLIERIENLDGRMREFSEKIEAIKCPKSE